MVDARTVWERYKAHMGSQVGVGKVGVGCGGVNGQFGVGRHCSEVFSPKSCKCK